MARHLPLEIRELEIVVAAPGLLGEIVAAAVQIEEDVVVEDRCVAGMNAHGEEGDVP